MKYVSLTFLISIFAFFTACEDDSLVSSETEYTYVTDTVYVDLIDTLQSTVVETRTDTIVLNSDRYVVEYDTITIDQECTQKDVNGVVTISCGSNDVIVNKATCDTTGFDPTTNFCYNGKVMEFCDGYAYNPARYFCYKDSLFTKYRGEIYDVNKYFIDSDSLFTLCKGLRYETSKYFCHNDTLITKCDGKNYDFATEFCDNGSIFTRCGESAYKTQTKFCYDDSLVYLCNGKTYDIKKEFCYDQKVFDLCNGKKFHALDYFCHNGYLVNYCEGHEFDPSRKFCYNDSLVDQQDCPTTLKNNGCGYFADERDSLMYKYVVIGEQTWMAQNLNYAYIQPTSRLDSSSFCYWTTTSRQEDYYSGSIKQQSATLENGTCPKYGRLYMWSAAMDSAAVFSDDGKGCGYEYNKCNPTGRVRGVCPEGWHLPSQAEWDVLFTTVGGTSIAGTELKQRFGWKENSGIDSYGFSAIPAGFLTATGARNEISRVAEFWYNRNYDYRLAYFVSFYHDLPEAHPSVFRNGTIVYDSEYSAYPYNNGARSIRCIKD